MAKLHFNYGAMNGGKSTRLIQTAFNYREVGSEVLVVKPGIDDKGDDDKGDHFVVSRAASLKVAVDIVLEPEMDSGMTPARTGR